MGVGPSVDFRWIDRTALRCNPTTLIGPLSIVTPWRIGFAWGLFRCRRSDGDLDFNVEMIEHPDAAFVATEEAKYKTEKALPALLPAWTPPHSRRFCMA